MSFMTIGLASSQHAVRRPRADRMDAVVVGGGPAGAGLASALARRGAGVTLLERERAPVDKVCGEFLSHEAARYLRELGVDPVALGAVPIDTLRLTHRADVATAALPFDALSLSRRVLDEALLAHARAAGVEVRRGCNVVGIERAEHGWRARLAVGAPVTARAAFLASGKHDVRGLRRPRGLQSDLVAFKMHWRLSSRQSHELSRHVEIVLFEGGYLGLEPIEGGLANLCLVVRRRRLRELGGSWESLIGSVRAESPHLETRLSGAEPCWAKPLALAAIPYGHVQRRSDGLFRLGDQAAVIPSFSGDGVSIALHSAAVAAATFFGGEGADVYQRRLAGETSGRVLFATLLSTALVRTPAQSLLAAAARGWPPLMAAIAAATRLPSAALTRALHEIGA